MKLVYQVDSGRIVSVRPNKLRVVHYGQEKEIDPAIGPGQALFEIDEKDVPADITLYSIQDGKLVKDEAKATAKRAQKDAEVKKESDKKAAKDALATFAAMKASDFNKLTANQQAKTLFDAMQALLARDA